MAATFLWLLCVCSLGNVVPVDSSHFMGGIIQWRPVNPAAFDGTVRILNSARHESSLHASIHGHNMHTRLTRARLANKILQTVLHVLFR